MFNVIMLNVLYILEFIKNYGGEKEFLGMKYYMEYI